jgi:ATP-dependent DNA helicase RecG
MSRLLEGEVGSGKTLVAIMAILNVALNKRQAVLMVPTEILAEQHYVTLTRLLEGYNFKISLRTSSHKEDDIGQADIIVGTHALIQENVRFNNLALAIVDEQHHFGVNQRQKLLDFNSDKDRTPHFLSLTATPIPRSLSTATWIYL